MAKSVCIIGKLQLARGAVTTLTNVSIENSVCDLIVETTLSQAGKVGFIYSLPIKTQYDEVTVYKPLVTGQNHMLHILNNFTLISLEASMYSAGSR